MTAAHEEAARLLRLARRDALAFKGLLTLPEVDFSVACFHAQQAAEKAIKAVLFDREVEFRRTHDLEELGASLVRHGGELPVSVERLRRLSPYAVEFRYNDEVINTLTASEAEDILGKILIWAEGVVQADSGSIST